MSKPNASDSSVKGPVDVLIVGAGAAGLTAAFAAAAAGARVLVVDRSDGSDSNFAISGGLIAAAGTPAQSGLGIEDDPANWSRDILQASREALPEALVELVTTNAAAALALIAEVAGEPFSVIESVRFPGHAVARLHELGGRSGSELARLLLERAMAHPHITVAMHCAVSGLLVEDGTVCGVRVRDERAEDGGRGRGDERSEGDERGTARDIRAAAVVLASGGFGANADMVRRFIPEMTGAFYIGSSTNRGDAFAWAATLGATPRLMTGYQGHGHATLDGMGRLGAGVTSVGALIVNRAGRRFVREDISPSALAGYVAAAEDGLGIEVYSESMHEAFLRFAPYREALERGAVRRFDELAGLCAAYSIDAAVLADTLARFNACARGEATDALGREHFGGEVLAPFWAVGVTGALVHTQGGLRVDARARVLRDDDRPIDGLFAAGGCALGITGASPAGYLPGHGLAQSMALGFVAGGAAARRAAHLSS